MPFKIERIARIDGWSVYHVNGEIFMSGLQDIVEVSNDTTQNDWHSNEIKEAVKTGIPPSFVYSRDNSNPQRLRWELVIKHLELFIDKEEDNGIYLYKNSVVNNTQDLLTLLRTLYLVEGYNRKET